MKTGGVVFLVFLAILVTAGAVYLIMNNGNSGAGQSVNTQFSQNPVSIQPPTSTQTPTETPASTETQNPETSVPAQTIPISSTGVNEVNISNLAFSPKTLTIHVGDTVIWNDLEDLPHKLISDSGNEINSLTFGKGDTYYHTFTAAGTYNYRDSINQFMNGTIIVA